jgi:hypothetical protein
MDDQRRRHPASFITADSDAWPDPASPQHDRRARPKPRCSPPPSKRQKRPSMGWAAVHPRRSAEGDAITSRSGRYPERARHNYPPRLFGVPERRSGSRQ